MADASNLDVAEIVVRRSTRYQQMTADERRAADSRFADFMDEDMDEEIDIAAIDNYEVEDDEDRTYQPAEESDAETEGYVELNEDTDDDDDEEEENDGQETNESYYIGKDGTQWSKKAPPTSRTRNHNVVDFTRKKPGPTGNIHDPYTIMRSIMTEEIIHLVLRETNRKGREVTAAWNLANPTKKKEWKPVTVKEFDAFVAILLYAGLTRSNHEPAMELWGATRCPIYKAALSYDRFMCIKQFIRFDNGNTRQQRLINSKTAAIDDIWQMLQHNLAAAYTPHEALTVDEQLFPYRGRTRFTQYIPSKPAKYGLKVWWLCDSQSYYPVKGMIYSGKLPNQQREINQGQNVVLDLVEKYLDAGRTIYADNFFTTLDLARILMRRKTAYVGTVRYNKTFIPQEFKKNPKRTINSTLFGFNEGDIALCSYVPKKNKVVNVLSTMHYTCLVDEQTEKRKPYAILDYNANKCGVDTMDQMLGTYSCKRATQRWPLAMFYNMLDVAALAAFTIYNEMKPIKRSDRRRSFLLLLTKQLATPNIEERALNNHITSYPRIRNAMEAFDVRVRKTSSNSRIEYIFICFLFFFSFQVLPRPMEGNAPSFAARSSRPSCRLCRSEYGRQRKTRAYCFGCGNAVCGEHSTLLHRCNTCAQGGGQEVHAQQQ